MKFLILAFCVAYASAAAVSNDQNAEVIRSSYEQSPQGDFQYVVETSNGIASQVSGVLKQFAKDEAAVVQTGSNQFQSPEGGTYAITFTADENGYQPQGAHLPTPPAPEPLPEYVVRALDFIAKNPYTEPKRL